METVPSQSTTAEGAVATPSTSPSAAEASPSGAGAAAQVRPKTRTGLKSSTLVIGSVGILALGTLLGIGVSRHGDGTATAAAATKDPDGMQSPAAAAAATGSSPWNPFREIRDMQLRMDKMFDQMTGDFRLQPRMGMFPDNPGYSLSLRVSDLKDRFEVHAYLPNAKASDVNVRLLDKQTLKVEVTNKTAAASDNKDAHEQVTEWGQYTQVIQLPAAVKGEQIKIGKPNHELIVTLPKA